MNNIELQSIEKITDKRFLNLYQLNYKNKVGKDKQYFISSRNDLKSGDDIAKTVNAVSIIALHEEKERLVLLKEYRMGINNHIWNFPAGLIDDGESIEETVKRELFEETGLELVNISRILRPSCSSAGLTDEKVTVVYCRVKGELTNKNTSDDEQIEVHLMGHEELSEMLNDRSVEIAARTQMFCDLCVLDMENNKWGGYTDEC